MFTALIVVLAIVAVVVVALVWLSATMMERDMEGH